MKFKFHLVPQEHELIRYQHESVALCEGLKELGYEFYGTCNYWFEPDENTYLIKEAPDDFKSDIDVYSTYYIKAFPNWFDKIDYSKINVFIDREDGLYGEYCNPKLKKFNLILRTHYNKNINYAYYNKNIQPWAFGLSNRIINIIDQTAEGQIVDRAFLSFRISHSLRGRAVQEMSPALEKKYPLYENYTSSKDTTGLSEKDKLYLVQSGHRHDPNYYKQLNLSLLTYAFGGFIFTKPFATNRIIKQFQKYYRLKAALRQKINKDNSSCFFIDQFDSWRLWESFYSNTCPIHLDFDYQGWVLPVMPKNKVHYWGVNGFNFKESAEELLGLEHEAIIKIAQAGKLWAKQHYSPKATAKRFIEMIKNE